MINKKTSLEQSKNIKNLKINNQKYNMILDFASKVVESDAFDPEVLSFAELDMEGNVQWYPINDFANYYSYLKFGDTLYTSGFGRAGYIEKNKSIIGKYVGSAKTYTLTGYFKMKVYKATIN